MSWDYPSAVNLCRDGAMKQADGNDDSVAPFETLQDPLDSAKSAAFDPYPLTDSHVRPRLAGETRTHQSTNGRYLGLVNRDSVFAYSNDANQAGCLQDWQSVLRIESAKEVAREQWKVHLLNSIGPAFPAQVSRQELLIPFAGKERCDNVFVARSNLHSKPWQPAYFARRIQCASSTQTHPLAFGAH